MSGFGGFGGRFGFSGPGNLDLVGCPSTDFVLLIQTNATAAGYTAATSTNQFRFYGVGTYDIDWGDGTVQTGVSGTQTRTYAIAGVYQIRVRNWTGATRQHAPPNSFTTDAIKIRQLQQWGTTQWTSCSFMFVRCVNMIGTYSDKPNLSAPNIDCAFMFYFAFLFNGSPYASMNDWDTSSITSMQSMFDNAISFNQPIGNWNVSNVSTFLSMFTNAQLFNQPLNNWNMSGPASIAAMFRLASSFNQDLNNWDISSKTTLEALFEGATAFNGDISTWNTSNVTTTTRMFIGASSFNKPINTVGSAWNVSNVTNMSGMFTDASAFNQPLNNWNTSGVTNMGIPAFSGIIVGGMFRNAVSFNQDISSWNTSNVTTMREMFRGATAFNQPLNSWDVSNVTDMGEMFSALTTVGGIVPTAFNQPLNLWNVSNVTNMNRMFCLAGAFNQDISSWDVSSVTDMGLMFMRAVAFNQPLNSWNVSNVTNMDRMFGNAFGDNNVFNQPLNLWNVSNVTNMFSMFERCNAFNQDLGAWVLNNNVNLSQMLNTTSTATGLSAENYSRTLIGWANERSATGNPNSRSLGAQNRRYNATVYGGSPYDNAVDARANLVLAVGSGGGGWTITGDAAV